MLQECHSRFRHFGKFLFLSHSVRNPYLYIRRLFYFQTLAPLVQLYPRGPACLGVHSPPLQDINFGYCLWHLWQSFVEVYILWARHTISLRHEMNGPLVSAEVVGEDDYVTRMCASEGSLSLTCDQACFGIQGRRAWSQVSWSPAQHIFRSRIFRYTTRKV